MKNIKNILQKVALGVMFLALSGALVNAGFGVSPADIINKHLKPGSTYTREFKLSRSGNLDEIMIVLEPEFGEANSWLVFTPGRTFIFEKGERVKTFKVQVRVPETAELKEYPGSLRVKANPSDAAVKGVTIAQGLKIDGDLTLTEENIESLAITLIEVDDIVKGHPVIVDITAKNEGNVDVSPTAKVTIMDSNNNVLEEHELSNLGVVKEDEQKVLSGQFITDLDLGEYYIEIEVFLNAKSLRKDLLVFKIMEEAPVVAKTEKEEVDTTPALFKFLQDNKTYVVWIVVAILAGMIIYFLISKLWKDKSEEEKEKTSSIALGSKPSTRQVLSIGFGFLVFVGLFASSLVGIEVKETIVKDRKEEVQGTQDMIKEKQQPMLNVIQSVDSQGDTIYPVYAKADTTSKVIYEAKEDETFTVVEETAGWYKVSLPNGTTGWVSKSIIKSVNRKEVN
ncbi:TPA: SH3 domain-containing protein [Candidatus Dojkabacteria bacterium]|uniref:SH3 domain-containing protein n=1 Tax=Candidatus Dojkabacteria bacterium TaxID=2099670 RepID=A0A832QG44_9BACT|nr:SH3 domain-containing protein [Candidatus Dojkabacteria bacterium]